ncbi:MAG: hypothetical protein GQE15_37495 [Archangiaceae bacterium]|nr:hypothetical protein [Archangiaceae bacterium]
MPSIILAACLGWWPVWEPVEALVARADTIVEAEVAADGQLVVKASLKGQPPRATKHGVPGRALLFFADGDEIARWRALESGEFDLPEWLLVPLDWSTTSVSRETLIALLARAPRTGVSGWTVNEQECSPCSLRMAFAELAFAEEGHVICMGDAGVDCIEGVRASGGWGATRPNGDSFVWVMDGGVEVISLDRRRDRPSFCGGARVVSTRCRELSERTCRVPIDQRVFCEETRAPRQVPVGDSRVRCVGSDLPVERYDEVGAVFSCGVDRWGLPPTELWPRGRCFRERFDRLGSMRCEGLNADGGLAGHLRAGVIE